MKKENRIYYLDNLKGFAMIMIIFGHCNLREYYPNLYNWVSVWHVPVYLIITGILLGYKSKKSSLYSISIINKIRKYLIPFYIFSFLYFTSVAILMSFSDLNRAVIYTIDSLQSILFLNGRAANWFLPCLLFSEILFIYEHKYMNDHCRLLINTVIAFIATVFSKYLLVDFTLILVILRILVGTFLIDIGYWIVVSEIIDKNFSFSYMFVSIILQLSLCIVNGETNMHGMNAGNYPLLYLFQITFFSLSIVFFFKSYLNKKIVFLTYFGENTLVSLVSHQMMIELLWAIDAKLLNVLNKLYYLQPLVLCVSVCCLEYLLIKQHDKNMVTK